MGDCSPVMSDRNGVRDCLFPIVYIWDGLGTTLIDIDIHVMDLILMLCLKTHESSLIIQHVATPLEMYRIS